MEELTKALKVPEDKFQSKSLKSASSRVANITGYLSEAITVSEFKELLLEYIFDGGTELIEGQYKDKDMNEMNLLIKYKYMNWD